MNSEESKEILSRLKHLKHQVDGAIWLIESGAVSPDPNFDPDYCSVPNTFRVGDFIIQYTQWTKCECSGTLPTGPSGYIS